MIHIYTGEGKGKTTASLGLCLRALGQGKRICLIQFLKKGEFGEVKMLRFLAKQGFPVEIRQFGTGEFVNPRKVSPQQRQLAREGIRFAEKRLSPNLDLLVLDEALIALSFGIISLADIMRLIGDRPETLELVLTGRGAPKELLAEADLVSEVKERRHYFDKGIKARKGIEY